MAHRQDRIIDRVCVVVALKRKAGAIGRERFGAIQPVRFRSVHLRKRWWYQKKMRSMIALDFLEESLIRNLCDDFWKIASRFWKLEKSKWYNIWYTHQMCWIWLWVGFVVRFCGPKSFMDLWDFSEFGPTWGWFNLVLTPQLVWFGVFDLLKCDHPPSVRKLHPWNVT